MVEFGNLDDIIVYRPLLIFITVGASLLLLMRVMKANVSYFDFFIFVIASALSMFVCFSAIGFGNLCKMLF